MCNCIIGSYVRMFVATYVQIDTAELPLAII